MAGRTFVFSCAGAMVALAITASLSHAGQGSPGTWVTPPPSVADVNLRPPSATEPFDPEKIGLISRASKLTGEKVEDSIGRNLGTLEDIYVDLETGRIAGCVVSTGKTRTLVPPEAFFPVSEERIVFNKDSALLREAPPYTQPFSEESMRQARTHFGAASNLAMAEAPVSVKGIRGKSLTGSSGRSLGQVLDLALDVPKANVVYVLVQSPSDRGEMRVLPPTAVTVSPDGGSLTLATDEQRFLAGPKVPTRFWTQVTLPEFASSVYRHYGLPKRDADRSALTPTGRSDEQIRSAVLSEIVHSPSLAAARARDLNISVSNGRVTLSGVVNSEGARDDLVSFASRVVGAANVEDRLTVR